MAHDFDDTLKTLVANNKRDYVQWCLSFLSPSLRQMPVGSITPLETEFKRSIIADAFLKVEVGNRRVILHFEFQASNDDDDGFQTHRISFSQEQQR